MYNQKSLTKSFTCYEIYLVKNLLQREVNSIEVNSIEHL